MSMRFSWVYSYKDSTGLEIDAIIQLDTGKWGAIEITLGGASYVEKCSKRLKRLKARIDETVMNPPSFMAVITSVNFAYRRLDGIYVFPVECLKD